MIEQLFGSKTRVKLLHLFYSNPNRSFYVREITRKIDEQINSVRRELANLLSIGIIVSDTNDHKLYYEVNQQYDYHEPLSAIFGGKTIAKKPVSTTAKMAKSTTGTDHTESDEIRSLGNVELAIYTGQFTRDESAGIDVLLVGDLNQAKVHNFIASLEARESKDIRYVIMSSKDFSYRSQINDRFIVTVLESKKQILVDKHNVL
ncbi:MAG: transcriptional regulator [Candidatus Saccharimonadales bacterium]